MDCAEGHFEAKLCSFSVLGDGCHEQLVKQVWNDIDHNDTGFFGLACDMVVVLKAHNLAGLKRPRHHSLVLKEASLHRFNHLLGYSVILSHQQARQRFQSIRKRDVLKNFRDSRLQVSTV